MLWMPPTWAWDGWDRLWKCFGIQGAFRLSCCQNVPIIHGRYMADQKSCSSTQQFRTRQLGNLLLVMIGLKWDLIHTGISFFMFVFRSHKNYAWPFCLSGLPRIWPSQSISSSCTSWSWTIHNNRIWAVFWCCWLYKGRKRHLCPEKPGSVGLSLSSPGDWLCSLSRFLFKR